MAQTGFNFQQRQTAATLRRGFRVIHRVKRVLRVVGGQIFLQHRELRFGPFLVPLTGSSPDGVSTAKRAVSGKTA